MVDMALFRNRPYRNGTLLISLFFTGSTSVWVTVAIFLQNGHGVSALTAALVGLPSAIFTSISSQIAGRYVLRAGRAMVAWGMTVALTALASSILVVAGVQLWDWSVRSDGLPTGVAPRGDLPAKRARRLGLDRRTARAPLGHLHLHLVTNCGTVRATRRACHGRLGYDRDPHRARIVDSRRRWGPTVGLVGLVAHRYTVTVRDCPGLHRLAQPDPVADRSARPRLGRCRRRHANRPTRWNLGRDRPDHLDTVRRCSLLHLELGFHRRVWPHYPHGGHRADRGYRRRHRHPTRRSSRAPGSRTGLATRHRPSHAADRHS